MKIFRTNGRQVDNQSYGGRRGKSQGVAQNTKAGDVLTKDTEVNFLTPYQNQFFF